MKIIKQNYYEAISNNMKIIQEICFDVYDKEIYIKACNRAEMLLEIKGLQTKYGKTCPAIVAAIRAYLGYRAKMWRRKEDKVIIVELARIDKAYECVLRRENVINVEKWLYF